MEPIEGCSQGWSRRKGGRNEVDAHVDGPPARRRHFRPHWSLGPRSAWGGGPASGRFGDGRRPGRGADGASGSAAADPEAAGTDAGPRAASSRAARAHAGPAPAGGSDAPAADPQAACPDARPWASSSWTPAPAARSSTHGGVLTLLRKAPAPPATARAFSFVVGATRGRAPQEHHGCVIAGPGVTPFRRPHPSMPS